MTCQKDPSTQECQDLFDEATKMVGVIYQQLMYKKLRATKAEKEIKQYKDKQLQADLDPDDLYHD